MSAIGPKQTSLVALHMSAFGSKADMAFCGISLSRSLLGVKRTWLVAAHMSAYDPKRTYQRSQSRGSPKRHRQSEDAEVTTIDPTCPRLWRSVGITMEVHMTRIQRKGPEISDRKTIARRQFLRFLAGSVLGAVMLSGPHAWAQ